MHIAINGAFWNQPSTGSGQYLRRLVQSLPAAAPQHRYSLVVPAAIGPIQDPPDGLRVVGVRTPFDTRSENLAKLWFEQFGQVAAAQKLKADLLHVPYAAPPLRSSVPVISTVHDIIWHVLPAYRGKAHVRAYYRLVQAGIQAAAHIITDSNHSRNDIIQSFGCDPERVTTIYLAAGEQYYPRDHRAAQVEIWQRYGIASPFIYYVGGYDVRKNVEVLVRAFAEVHQHGSPAKLVLAGKALGKDPAFFPDIDGLIRAQGLIDCVHRVEVPPEDNPLFFAAASLAATPSYYEGFGLPPLEAMSCGTPVLVSAASSLPEVVGEAGICLPPHDIQAWAEALQRVLDDGLLRSKLRTLGLQQAAKFSWSRMVNETVAVYERVGRQR
jgi:Glycosyltransferase